MKVTHTILIAISSFASFTFAQQKSFEQTLEASYKIDDLLDAEYKDMGIEPNAIVDDGKFVRRAYLNIIGRIPTAEEARHFIDDSQPGKRVKLIDKLVDSEGFKGKMFLFYSELLRLKTNTEVHGLALHKFLYDAAHSNKPYDKLVYELLAADGHVADNPAASYYLRDTGMLLDNVSNSVQVFLGTQIGCAQCHDHPFEDTTQMDFYKLAAFSGGTEYRRSDSAFQMLKKAGLEAAKADGVNIAKIEERQKRQTKGTKKGGNAAEFVARKYARVAMPVFKYYRRNEVNDKANKELKLPHDYQYSDGKPDQVVQPGVLFGSMPDLHNKEDRKKVFAHWVTSPENPQFAKVLANRLWAHAFGYGLAMPLDDWNDRTKVSHEKVLEFLTEEIKSNGFDMKQTLRTIYFSTLFQRAVSPIDVEGSKQYHFAGPLLRRMKGEELYDSMLTLENGVIDDRKNEEVQEKWDYVVKSHSTIKKMSGLDLMKLGQTITTAEKAADGQKRKLIKLRLAIAAAKKEGDADKVRELGKEYKKTNLTMRSKMKDSVMNSSNMQEGAMMMDSGVTGPELVRYALMRNARIRGSFRLRASEQPQPFKAGTFVREFGTTDGEVSNNSSDHASVPQALSMLNGNEVMQVTDGKGTLPQALREASSDEEKLNILFLSIYSRYPTADEKLRYRSFMNHRTQAATLAKAMINSKNFLFIQ